MSLKNFEILNELGKGTYSTVYKVKRITDEKIYALKKVRIMSLKEKEKRNALNEIRILASINHPNIISYKEAFFDDESRTLCLVLEYADGGDLYQRILQYQKKGKYMSETFIWNLMIQIVRGMKALHDLNILHRDLKSANVFLTKSGEVKIGDMNVSKVSKDCIMHTQTGTPYYASPEVWKDIPYDIKSDVWSLGCVLYESASLKPPFQADNMEGLYKKVIKGEYNSIPKSFSIELSHVIYGMLQVNPNYRFSCAQILSLPSVVKHMNGTFGDNEFSLLQTIKFPKNFNMISKNLPEPNYIQMKPMRNKSTIMPNVRKDVIIMRNASESKSRKNLIKGDAESPGVIKRSFIKENYKLIHLHRAGQILKKYSAKSLVPKNDPVKGEIFLRKPGTNRSLVLPGY